MPKYIKKITLNKKHNPSVYQIFKGTIKANCKYRLKWNALLQIDIAQQKDLWRSAEKLPFITTADSSLQWLQYRIVHRCIATNKYLSQCGVLSSGLCSFCSEYEETISHLFYHCELVSSFWEGVRKWIREITHIDLRLSETEVCLIVNEKRIPNINLIIFLAKKFIYKQRIVKRSPRLDLFKKEVKSYYEIEKYLYKQKGKSTDFTLRWLLFHESLTAN